MRSHRLSGWVTGTDLAVPNNGAGHLVIEVSPRPTDATQILFHGAGDFSDLRAAGMQRIWRVTGTWYRVLGSSVFLDHLVLIWTWSGHTYAVGFHTWTTDSRRYGLDVAEGMALLPPG